MRPLELGLQAFGPYHQGQVINFSKTKEAGIFLIHGNTGAGKSSILEAMVWALYGKEGIGDKKKDQIRYTQAAISETTFVRFDFSVGADIYRVYRELKPQKKQGTNELSALNEKVVLAKRNLSTAYQSNEPDMAYTAYVENGVDETGKLIVKVLSMDEKQFTKIIMIPQGKFKDLLLSPPPEREELLADLLDLHRFDFYEEYLANQVKELKTLLDASFQKQAELRAYLVENGGDRLDELRTEYSQLEAQVRVQSSIMQGLGAQIEQARAFEQQELKVSQYRAELEDLEARAPEMENLKAKLVDYETFKNNHYLLVDLRRFEQETKNNEAKKAVLQKSLLALDLDALKSRLTGHETAVAQAQRTLQDQGPKLEVQLTLVRETKKLRNQVAEAKLGLDESIKNLEPYEQKYRALETNRRDQIELQASIKKQEHFVQALRDLFVNFRNFGSRLLDREALLANLRLKKREHMLEIQKHRDCHDQIPVARSMVEHWDNLEKQYAHAMIAQELVNNEPCPVCGSHDHPRPRALPEDSIDLDRLRRDRENLDKLNDEYTKAKIGYEQKKKEIDEIEAKLRSEKELFDGLRAEFDESCAKVLSLSPRPLPLVEKITDALKQDLNSNLFESLKNDLTGLGQEEGKVLQTLSSKIMDEESFATIERDYREQEAVVNQHRARHDLLVAQLEERQRSAEGSTTSEDTLIATIEGLHRELENEQRLLTLARSELESASTRTQELRSEIMTIEGILQTSILETARLKNNIQDIKDRTSLDLHSLAEVFERFDALEAKSQVQTHESRVQELVTSLKLIEADKKQKPAQSLSELEVLADQAQREIEQSQNRLGQLQKNFEVIDGLSKKLEIVQRELKENETAHSGFNEITLYFRGNNEAKVSFKRFVIGLYLDKILIEANQHLQTMTLGRYQFRRSDLVVGRQHKAGLNLEIIDSYSGDNRLVNTLSGGESFMASLSLALGLSAYVQKLSGGKKMEAFFIDEGFGTLDEDTLEQAMSVLETIGKSGRTLGIISHVKELKERIPLKLHIVGSKTGSHAKWSI